jgi:hypothetical protein
MSNTTSRAFHNKPSNNAFPIEDGKKGETMVNKTIEEWMKENGYDKEVVFEEKSLLQRIKEFILNFKPYF